VRDITSACANGAHRVCTGCHCPCHHVPPPIDQIRAVFEAARRRARAQGGRCACHQQQHDHDDSRGGGEE
jgi:hypothetical protein